MCTEEYVVMSKPQVRSETPSLNQNQQNKKGAPTSVTRIGQGLVSCLQIPELHQFAGRLQSVCLHGNSIARIEGLDKLTALRELNLSSNNISQLENISQLGNLTSLNLASNKLTGTLGSLAGLSSLTHLNVSYNALSSLAGIGELQGPDSKLKVVNAKNNALASLQVCAVLAGCVSLRDLSVGGNPISQLPNYRQAILSVLPHITQLDNLSSDDTSMMKFDVVAAQNLAAAKLQAFQPVQISSANQSFTVAHQQVNLGQLPTSDTQSTPKSQHHAEPFQGQTIYMKQPYAAQQNQASIRQPTDTSRSSLEHQHSPAQHITRPVYANSVTPVRHAQQHTTSTYTSPPPISSGVDNDPQQIYDRPSASRQQQHPSHSPPQTQYGQHPSRNQGDHSQSIQRIYLKDASIQAGNSAEIDKATKDLKAELKSLKKQLTDLTGRKVRTKPLFTQTKLSMQVQFCKWANLSETLSAHLALHAA